MSTKHKSREAIVAMVNRESWFGKIYDTGGVPTEIRDACICFLHQRPGTTPDTVILTPMRAPYGLSSETVKRIHINPANVASWTFLDDLSTADQEQIKGFIGAQSDLEAKSRADTAGIHLATASDLSKLSRGHR